MKILKKAQAGSFESSDIIILIEPSETKGRKLKIYSSVALQYGDQIKRLIEKELDKFEIDDIHLIAKDKGALDITIAARIETALKRATQK